MRARTVLFLKGIYPHHVSAAIFSLRSKLYGMRARALAVRRRRRLLLSRPLGGSAAKWTNVVWPIKRRQTDKPTNKHTLLFYRYRFHVSGKCMAIDSKLSKTLHKFVIDCTTNFVQGFPILFVIEKRTFWQNHYFLIMLQYSIMYRI